MERSGPRQGGPAKAEIRRMSIHPDAKAVGPRTQGGSVMQRNHGRTRAAVFDFKLPDFARERIGELEAEVNGTIERGLAISSSTISEA